MPDLVDTGGVRNSEIRGHVDALASAVAWMRRNLASSSSLGLELELRQIRSHVFEILAAESDDMAGFGPRIASVASSTTALVEAITARGTGSKMLASMRNEADAMSKLARRLSGTGQMTRAAS